MSAGDFSFLLRASVLITRRSREADEKSGERETAPARGTEKKEKEISVEGRVREKRTPE